MKNVTLLGMRHTMAYTVITPMDVFALAGIMWNHLTGIDLNPYFKVRMVTTTGKPLRCLNGALMVPDGSIHDVDETDLVIVSSIMDIDKTLKVESEVVDWLIERRRKGSHIATICSAAFVLAETGMLDGKTATTHWAFADRFKKRYPRVKLKPGRLVTDEGDLFCSGGYSAAIDLSLYLVEKYCGHETAVHSSKALISDIKRSSQTPYAAYKYRKDHGDEHILLIQEWIEAHYNRKLNYNDLAHKFGMSSRTLVRRFKSATGETPLAYQQNLRIDAAKRLLENGTHSFDEITYRVGYEDGSTFRKMFSKHTNLAPREYRKKFQRVISAEQS